MPSRELFSGTMYQQHIIAHIYLLQIFLQDDLECGDNVRFLIPTREKLDEMDAIELMALFDRLCVLGETLDPDTVRSVRSTLSLY